MVLDKLETESKAIELVNLNKFVQSLPDIQADLQEMKEETKQLRFKASQLSDGLRGVKRELLTQLSRCNTPECKDIQAKYRIGQLDTNGIDYNQVCTMTTVAVVRFKKKKQKKNRTKNNRKVLCQVLQTQ